MIRREFLARLLGLAACENALANGAKAYMNRPDIAALFDDVKPSDFPAQLGVKLFLMQRRMAFAMCFLFTYVFDRV